jgi:hypothetical protein
LVLEEAQVGELDLLGGAPLFLLRPQDRGKSVIQEREPLTLSLEQTRLRVP